MSTVAPKERVQRKEHIAEERGLILFNDDVNSYVDHGHIETLYQILYSGFKGYQEYTDEQLEVELNERDISTVFGENDE